MRYLKLFENFDRYEFGEFQGDYDNLVLSQLERDIKSDVVNFKETEMKEIRDIFMGSKGFIYNVTEAGPCFKLTKLYGGEFIKYNIYALGDYCYCIIGHVEVEEMGEMPYNVVCYYENFDGFDSLIEKLKKLNE